MEALQTPANNLAPILIDCICRDARWDRQVEFRAEYYASLVIDTQIDIAPVAPFLKCHDCADDTSLAIETLGQLSIKKHPQAISILRQYIWYGPYWGDVICQLAELGDDSVLEGLDAIICGRYPNTDELLREVEPYIGDDGFNRFLSMSNSKLRNLLDSPEAKANSSEPRWWMRPNPDYSGYTLQELFNLCDLRNSVRLSRSLCGRLTNNELPFLEKMVLTGTEAQQVLALRCIGLTATRESFEYVKNYLERMAAALPENPAGKYRSLCAAALYNIACAPSEVCLETGRGWFQLSRYPVSVAGQDILEKYATVDDIPMLRKTISETLQNEEEHEYKLCSAVDALKNFKDTGVFPEVQRVYYESIYSYARMRAAESMVINAPAEFASKYAYECLFDCEHYTKIAGIEYVNAAEPCVYQRLKQLSEDSSEDDEIREKAGERLC